MLFKARKLQTTSPKTFLTSFSFQKLFIALSWNLKFAQLSFSEKLSVIDQFASESDSVSLKQKYNTRVAQAALSRNKTIYRARKFFTSSFYINLKTLHTALPDILRKSGRL